MEQELDRVLVVIAVTLEGSARRLVTIRSALQVVNELETTAEISLVPPPFSLLPNKQLRIPPSTTYPIPISHLMSEVIIKIKINYYLGSGFKTLHFIINGSFN